MKMYIKRFLEWIGLKERLHEKTSQPPFVNEGDIWWASLGENIGGEINGKSKLFSRPVIVLKKLSHTFYFVVPTTTKPRTGSWYIHFKQNAKQNIACLHQARAIDYRRLSSKLGELDDVDFSRVKDAFFDLYR